MKNSHFGRLWDCFILTVDMHSYPIHGYLIFQPVHRLEVAKIKKVIYPMSLFLD